MPRKPRVFVDDGYYHVISRGNNKQTVFPTGACFFRFKEMLLVTKRKYRFKLFHYCLMPNHIHCLIQITKGRDLANVMHDLLLDYSRWFKTEVGYLGYLWQGRYRSPLIDRENYMLECGRYIERNPVRAGLARAPENYAWSSHRFYASGADDPLVDVDPYFETFGFTPEERRLRYKDFVRLEGPYDALLDEKFFKH